MLTSAPYFNMNLGKSESFTTSFEQQITEQKRRIPFLDDTVHY